MKNYRNPETGWSSHMQVQLADLHGRAMEVEGFAVSHICERGGGSTALMRWDLDGQIGWGKTRTSGIQSISRACAMPYKPCAEQLRQERENQQ